MQPCFQQGIIRFYNANQVCGAGLLVSEHYALTCAHVINTASGQSENSVIKPTASVKVDFPFSSDKRQFNAKVVFWKHPEPDGSGDIAGLELEEVIPGDVAYPPLYKLNDLWDHRFRAYGFPANYQNSGIFTTGKVLSPIANGWFLIESNKQAGYFIQPGFSGTPIWDEELSGVIGIAVAAARDITVKTAFIIPVSYLVDAWPDLNRFVQIPAGLKFNLSLQDFLQENFSDAELSQFCIENYVNVVAGFTTGMGLKNKIERLVDYCDHTHTMDSLVEKIKKRSSNRYHDFIADFCSTSLGISKRQDDVNFTSATVVSEYKNVTAQAQIPPISNPGFQDFAFHDRINYCDQILKSNERFIELYGPSGFGKTFILKHIQERDPNIFTIYIDLKETLSIDKEWLLQKSVSLLEGSSTLRPFQWIDLVTAIDTIYKNKKKSLFLFLFDSATEEHLGIIDWLTGKDGLLNNNDFYEMLDTNEIARCREIIKIVVASRQPLVKANITTNCGIQKIPLYPFSRSLDTSRDLLILMLGEISEARRGQKLKPEAAEFIVNKILHLTNGHPKSAKLLLLALANNNFLYKNAPWKDYFKNYVLPVIQTEMLSTLDDQLIPVFWVLSVFRQFDQRLLGTLLSRKIIAGDLAVDDNQLYAGQLRIKLSKSHLVIEPQQGQPMYTINPVVRRVLALSMEYFQPKRFQFINSLALEIYTDWLFRSNPRGGGERALALFFELIYHSLKALTIDLPISRENICEKMQEVVKDSYLPALLKAIDSIEPDDVDANRASYLPLLKSNWDNDVELREAFLRATDGDECHKALSYIIYEFTQKNSIH